LLLPYFWTLLLIFGFIAGPYNVNGVPLRRVNQKYVIATSTKVSLDGVDVSKIDDSYFARAKNEDANAKTSPEKKATQAAVDAQLKANVDKVELLGAFLSAKFRLRNTDKPHSMKF
jgi:large subunit ribosomal protein L6e